MIGLPLAFTPFLNLQKLVVREQNLEHEFWGYGGKDKHC
jgi:hypothetical protein